ncbi:hypothetical protein [Parasitella parasitica]|uniref:Uncharacterized protein n=1 Tax=Parasitella parasitica TaxID=35722 RepID=A0A0B7NEA8_9FUNG|nr:hypothetical protein [Parasitella parasitica]
MIAPSQYGGRPPGQETRARRAMIAVHLEDYLNTPGYKFPAFKYGHQSVMNEAEKMYTSYIVIIKSTFGNQLRRVLRSLLKVQARSKTLRLQAALQESTTGVYITNQQLKTRIKKLQSLQNGSRRPCPVALIRRFSLLLLRLKEESTLKQ